MGTFSQDLHIAFHKRLKVAPPTGEVQAFTCLTEAFTDVGRDYHVDVYHGARSRVAFRPSKRWRLNAGCCELADLLVVTYRRGHRTARATFVQCKLEGVAISGSANKRLAHYFLGNYEQWDLLTHRPLIKPLGTVRPPADVLSNATLPSIGSFIFFLQPGTKSPCDLVYTVAENLTRRGGITRHGRLELQSHRADRTLKGYRECLAVPSIKDWGRQLSLGQVGSPIRLPRDNKGRNGSDPDAGEWLAGILRVTGLLTGRKGRASRRLARLAGRGSDDRTPLGLGARSMVLIILDERGIERRPR